MPNYSTCNQNGSLYKLLEYEPPIVIDELRYRAGWFIKLRCFVPLAILIGIGVADWAGVETGNIAYFVFTALFIFVYNSIFYIIEKSKFKNKEPNTGILLQTFAWAQIGFDYFSMFLLIHFTGGISSPLIFFFIFHIIFASILLSSNSSYIYSSLVVVGVVFIAVAEYFGWIPSHQIVYEERFINLSQQPFHFSIVLLFFSASVFITAFSTNSIMTTVKARISNLTDISTVAKDLNGWLKTISIITTKIGSNRELKKTLDSVMTDLLQIMGVNGLSVKLLSSDGIYLDYEASQGLDECLTRNHRIEIKKSLLDERILNGEPFVICNIKQGESFQCDEDLQAFNIKTVLFVPMKIEKKVVGILGAYSQVPDKFSQQDIFFFKLAAGLLACAVDISKAYGKVFLRKAYTLSNESA